jgi:hypothetical protein
MSYDILHQLGYDIDGVVSKQLLFSWAAVQNVQWLAGHINKIE